MPTLMGHLAQFSAFAKQGEVLCTQGLAHLLRNLEAAEAFNNHYLKPADIIFSGNLSWKAEARQKDWARPDLEALTSDAKPAVKIEAKLGAVLSEGQLQSYIADLHDRAERGLLLVLVPRYRIKDAIIAATQAFGLSGDGPQWRLGSDAGYVVTVTSWEQILDILAKNSSATFASDYAQFRDLYRALNGDYFEASREIEWRDRELNFLTLVDKTTRLLAPSGQLLPMGSDGESDPIAYQRRYVCRSSEGTKTSCYSIGIRDPFLGYKTPIWLRFHRETGMFDVIHQRLMESDFSPRLVEHRGHIWLPLDLPSDETDGKLLVDALERQARTIECIAYPTRLPG